MKSQDQIEDSEESPERSQDQSGFSLFWVFFFKRLPCVTVICFIVLKVAQSTKGSLTLILVVPQLL